MKPSHPQLETAWWIELYVLMILLATLIHSARGQVWFAASPVISTNRPAFDFTAAGGTTAYWHSSNYCWTATFSITGDTGVYDLLWDYDLLPRYTNWFSPSNYTIVGHGWLTVYPPITNLTGNVTVTYPAKPSPESYWLLKKR